jgi:HAD superfamily hydrolase (TIGR01459 family)
MNKIIKNFRDISQEYDAFMFDLWGVLYEGGPFFKDALEVLTNLHLLNKPVVLISNSPFLNKNCEKNIEGYGLSKALYKAVLTAGDFCMQHIQENFLTPQKFYVIDKNYWDEWKKFEPLHHSTTSIEEADAILCLAVPSDVEFPEEISQHFDAVFERAIKRNLKMICANPDLFVYCSEKKHLRPGLLLLRYQQLGGEVLSFGKPFPEIFQHGLKILGNPKRVLMTGDTEHTDIQGASKHNIDTMLITSSHEDGRLVSKATYFSKTVKW